MRARPAVSSALRENDNDDHLIRPAPLEAWQKLAEIMRGAHQTFVREIDDGDSGQNLLGRERMGQHRKYRRWRGTA